MLQHMIFGNPLASWLFASAAAVLTVFVVWALRQFIVRRLSRYAALTSTRVDDSLIAVTRRTRLWLVWLPALWVAAQSLTLPERIDALLRGAAILAMIWQFGLWLAAGIDFWVERSRARAAQEGSGAATSLAALTFVAKTALWAILLLVALDNLGIDVTAMIAGLGVGGVAVALAVQNILGDLFASLSIVIDKPFVIGDFIIVDEYMGTVEHVGLKTTRIRSLGGEQLVFSNSDLLKARLRNYKRMRERRVVFQFGLLFETPADKLERVAALLREIVSAQPQVRFDRAHFASIGEWSYNFEVVYWMLDPDYNQYMDTQQSINLAIVRRLDQEGIGLAYPARKLHMAAPLQVRGPADRGPGSDAWPEARRA
ncbi:mechanosensitive ion channel family protein [Solimonas variicoloris]|uniref:mechanosensitive ion channel family protein n=1 Tax=Solimonas variicoloris TaxID=254408 RepID=UPI00036148C4|nr:mechanosensitive ion channel family protein [Solimonas variicoloris]